LHPKGPEVYPYPYVDGSDVTKLYWRQLHVVPSALVRRLSISTLAHQPPLGGEEGSRRARTNTELPVQILNMRPGGAGRDSQFLGNLFVGSTPCEMLQNLALPLRNHLRRGSRCLGGQWPSRHPISGHGRTDRVGVQLA
jgi:hypothetical protein